MNPDVKADWIAALRSGEYQQGLWYLRSADDKFCCLGVLCDRLDGVKWVSSAGGWWGFKYGGVWRSATLPSGLLDELAIPSSAAATLVNLNDDQGATFDEIADWIEENL